MRAASSKLVKLTLSLFRTTFSSSKCKTAAKMAVARIKLLRNKREVVVRQMRQDIAMLLRSGHDATARIRVEHVIREQNVLAANEFIELFCELVVARLSIIAKQRECPQDLKEGIASLIFAAPRCSEIPELVAIQDVFEKKYGKDFVSAATDLRPSCGVNRMLIDKLSVRTPTGEVKLKVMKEIAKEYQIEWDTTESETELLNPPQEDPIEGPKSFASPTSLPLNPIPALSANQYIPTNRTTEVSEESDASRFQDIASAAAAAADSAKQAIAAAQAAAYLANQNSNHGPASKTNSYSNASHVNHTFETTPGFTTCHSVPRDPPIGSHCVLRQFEPTRSSTESQNFGGSHYLNDGTDVNDRHVHRRHSNNAPSTHSDMKFDESDCDEEIEIDATPPVVEIYVAPNRPPPPLLSSHVEDSPGHSVHPKLPDYDDISARFEALKFRKSMP